jgi:hypothetical protein
MKQVSALLTLLLGALLAGPLSAAEARSGRSAPAALSALDLAHGAASLNSKQAARDTASRQADDEPASADPGPLPAAAAIAPAGPALPLSSPLHGAAPAQPHRAYRARAPPTK